jgi:hypothetical protein
LKREKQNKKIAVQYIIIRYSQSNNTAPKKFISLSPPVPVGSIKLVLSFVPLVSPISCGFTSSDAERNNATTKKPIALYQKRRCGNRKRKWKSTLVG